ncbi:hypothetical protein KFU94_67180 [Chloroflexi bacterium TSY]|nr:hypothetical protein [Chloroflexi bacterium TSY]
MMVPNNQGARENKPRRPETNVFLKGVGSSHAIFIKAKQLFTILINRLDRPTKQVNRENAFGITISAIGH